MSIQGEPLSDIKQSGKHNWRGKIWSPEGKFGRKIESKESTNEDIDSFLHAGGTKANAPTAPRIDVAVARKPLPLPQVSPSEIVDVYRRPKPRQNKGLRVTFQKAAPEIIGEGGDEAELPARDVMKSCLDVSIFGQAQLHEHASDESSGRPRERPRDVPDTDHEASLRPPPMQRRATGFDDLPIRTGNNDHYQNADYEDSVSFSPAEEKHKPLPQPPLDQGEDNHDYKTGARLEPSLRKRSPMRSIVDDDSFGMAASLEIPVPEILASNSVSPRASPQPPVNYQGSSGPNYRFPPTASEAHSPPKSSKSDYQARPDLPDQPLAAADPKVGLLRHVAKGLGDDSLNDFESRVRRFNDIFRLGVSARGDPNKLPFVQWIRTAGWWFVKGRGGLESAVRSRSLGADRSQSGSEAAPSMSLTQAWLNLAKAWWIIRDITPEHPEIRRFGSAGMASILAVIKNFGDQELAELVEVHLSLVANMRALTMSMKRNEMLPSHAVEIQRLDPRVLLDLPDLPRAFASLVINNASTAPTKSRQYISRPFFPILVGDTGRFLSFGRMFAEASLDADDHATRNFRFPCVLSVLRERNDWGVQAAIASQDGQMNLVIQTNHEGGLTWRDVQWKIPFHSMQVKLLEGVDLNLLFSEKDFKTLWGIYDYTRQIQRSFSARNDEDLIFERSLANFYCNDPAIFPSDPVPDCRLRLFEKRTVTAGGPGQRKIHDGYRLTVVTPPERKTLSSVNYLFGKEQPILFNYAKSKHGHSLVLTLPPNLKLSPIFHAAPDPEVFRSLLCGTFISKEDHVCGCLPLRSLSVTSVSVDQISRPGEANAGMQAFHKLRIVDKGPPPFDNNAPTTAGSEHLQIMAESDIGIFTDRLNLRTGELQMKLSVESLNEMTFLRPPQQDMTWSVLDSKVSEEELDLVCKTLHGMATSQTKRAYHFRSASTLHSFQSIITGYKVHFDGSATNFAISRKGMVVSHKRWEATFVRLQVIKNGKEVQLIAFFKDFSHGACMNFVLKATDVLEVFSKSGIFYICLADANFALPKGEEDQTRDFVCLDTPEYPSEHDDITIGFDNEPDRDRFAETLPAPVNKMSRMASLRR